MCVNEKPQVVLGNRQYFFGQPCIARELVFYPQNRIPVLLINAKLFVVGFFGVVFGCFFLPVFVLFFGLGWGRNTFMMA